MNEDNRKKISTTKELISKLIDDPYRIECNVCFNGQTINPNHFVIALTQIIKEVRK